MRDQLQIKLPAAITGTEQASRAARRGRPVRTVQPTGRVNAPKRPIAAPRRGGY
ncbi:hypothetical protein [Nocardia sp. NPDC052566]|uniref:hypothetical protein n=1 Tax=Nocardia sp. NPDC052566 TaxID=3364330 RepID=UPI0037C51341